MHDPSPQADFTAVILARLRRREPNLKEPAPTEAIPGSPEKVEVLIYRRRHKMSLWARDDLVDPDLLYLRYKRLNNNADIPVGIAAAPGPGEFNDQDGDCNDPVPDWTPPWARREA